MNISRLRECLDNMGIPLWLRREGAAFPGVAQLPSLPFDFAQGKRLGSEQAAPLPSAPLPSAPLPSAPLREREEPPSGWDSLRAQVAACTACPLHQTRHNTVFGVGSRQAAWMLIGEAPGADEDAQGEPFVGRAGQLLNAMLRAVGVAREAVYIANVAKCRPPGNRNPNPQEMAACGPYLEQQIALLQPKLIIALGAVAARYLLQDDAPLWKVRGREHSYHGIPLVVTYHPAYLLRKPSEKRKAWEDWRFIADFKLPPR